MSGRDSLRVSPPSLSAMGWAAPTALAFLFVALVAWSFRRWADVHIDFGNDLYIAWRLSEGDALYRDIAQRNGPLSHAWNGLLFSWFGVSIRTLVIANLGVLAAIAAMLWRIFARACDRTTAFVCVAVLLCVFAFGQYGPIGNFNYVTPYHHFQTHGLALGLAQLVCLGAAARRASAAWLFGAGICLGAVFLTKLELFVPCAAMALAAFLARGRGVWRTSAGARGEALALAAGALLPVAGFAVWLGLQMPVRQALAGLLGNWLHLSGLGSDVFYLRGAGLDDVSGNLLRSAAMAALVALATLSLVALDRLLAPRLALGEGRSRRMWTVLALLGALAFVLLWLAPIPWWRSAAALPWVAVGAVALLAWKTLALGDLEPRRRLYPLWLLAVYAAALLAKIALAPSYDGYGFVLAMPTTLLGVAGWVHGLPALLRRHGGGQVARALSLAVVAAACVFFLSFSHRVYATRTFPIGSGGDTILAAAPRTSARPRVLAQTLRFLEARLRPGETLLVLPEGAQLNYWLRVENPSRFLLFLPTELRAFGEGRMLADLRADPPDYVVLVHRLWREFGVGPFGRDPRNGRALREWVDVHYRRVERFGAEPFGTEGFGVVVLERSEPSSR